jgi:hypothetical protein
MTIVVYDMQFKGMKTKCIMWRKLNTIYEKKVLGTPIFKWFMVDDGQAN